MKRTIIGAAILAAFGALPLLGGCDGDSAATIESVEFIGMDTPATDDQIASTYTTAKVRITYSDGSVKEQALDYNVLFANTDKVGSSVNAAGQYYDHLGSPILDPYGQPVIAETPDGNSLLKIDGAPATGMGGNPLSLITHWEYDWILSNGAEAYKEPNWYSRMPTSMTLTTIDQNKTSGKLTAVTQRPIDFSGVMGTWINCFASQTPWNTHLGSEEDYDLYFSPADSGNYTATSNGLKALTEVYFRNTRQANPYHYGFLPEVTVKADNSTSVVKHYSMGRATWEMAKVMPDGKTAFYGDDGSNVGLFMYVADKAGDLSAGTLYAAKWTQLSDQAGGRANLTWHKLGHASDAEVKALIDAGTSFGGIWETSTTAAAGFKAIRAGSTTTEYIKLKPGMEQAAAFLETRRYAAYLGATTEWNKMEGVAVNGRDKKVYIAMSYIDKGMKRDTGAPADDIQLAKLNAGATYTMDLASGQKDTSGAAIGSDYVGTLMYVEPALLGEDIAADSLGNTANPNKVANTDNVFFSENLRTLFIGEDSGTHVNNFVWAYNVDTGKLSRILSLVSGAEATGLQAVDNLNGFAYVMSNYQHAGEFIGSMNADLKARLSPRVDKFKANVGYIGGLPSM